MQFYDAASTDETNSLSPLIRHRYTDFGKGSVLEINVHDVVERVDRSIAQRVWILHRSNFAKDWTVPTTENALSHNVRVDVKTRYRIVKRENSFGFVLALAQPFVRFE